MAASPFERIGWLVVGVTVGYVAASYALSQNEPQGAPAAATGVGKNPRLVAAGRKGIVSSGMNTRRYECRTCGLVSTAGPLTRHQQAHGHVGRVLT